MSKILPRYPIYVPSKGRADICMTARFLIEDEVPFYLVIEEQEYDLYAPQYEQYLLVLPFSNQGSVIPARNWIKDHSVEAGDIRHWQLDDNIRDIRRWHKKKRIPVSAGIGLSVAEDFVDRYENIAIAGLNYKMFAVTKLPPFFLNCHVYSCSLILNEIPHRWRGKYNEDTDICLQVLSDGWCTVLINAFLVEKIATLITKGGNTSEIYHGDGRLKMARALERRWPGVVRTGRRFRRPQHIVFDSWRRFDTPLKRKPGIDPSTMEPNDYGIRLRQVRDELKSPELQQLLSDEQARYDE